MKSLLFFFSALSLFSLSSWASDDEFDYPNTPLPTPQTPHYPLYDGLSNPMEITPSRKRKNQDYIQATTLKKVKLKKNDEKKNALELLINDIAEKASEDPSLIITYKGGVQKMAIGWWDSEEYGLKKIFPGTQLTTTQKTKAGKIAIALYNQKIIKQKERACEEALQREFEAQQEICERQRKEKPEKSNIRADMNFSENEKEKIILRVKGIITCKASPNNSWGQKRDLYVDILNHHEEIGLFNEIATHNWDINLGFYKKYTPDTLSKRTSYISQLRDLIRQAARDVKEEENLPSNTTIIPNETIPSSERIVIEEVLP